MMGGGGGGGWGRGGGREREGGGGEGQRSSGVVAGCPMATCLTRITCMLAMSRKMSSVFW